MADRFLGHYRLLETLGAGGMGTVYRAVDETLGREVALKVLRGSAEDPEHLERLRREARILASLEHPGIVRVYSVEEAEGQCFYTMELVRGRSLASEIGNRGLAVSRLLRVARELADAVAAAHEKGVVHRDLKPANVLSDDRGRIRILDFGLASVAEDLALSGEDDSTISASETGGLAGTLPYLAPEVLTGGTPDTRSDLFSLGVLLYEAACGRRPFHARSAPELFASILRSEPVPLEERAPHLPTVFAVLVGRCLEKDPGRRLPSARELELQLEHLEEGRGIESPDPSIAVLPFVDLSAEGDQAHLCEGLADELIHALNRIGGLRVASRLASFQLRDASLGVEEIARRLRVDTICQGTLRKEGEEVRITVELVDVDTGYDLWTERFDRRMTGVLRLEDEIAQRIARALRITLEPSTDSEIAGPRGVEATECYLRGRQYMDQYRRRGMETALEMFARTIELEPGFARAWAGIAQCHAYLYVNADRDPRHLGEALTAGSRALELDPDSAEAHVARGVALSAEGREAEAEREFETALELEPRCYQAAYHFARHCFSAGRPEKAIELYEAAARIDPNDFQAPLLVAQSLDDLGRPREATAARRRGVALAEERIRWAPDDVRALYMGANGLVALGRIEQGLEWARRARALDPGDPMLFYNLACIYGLAAEVEPALTCLEEAIGAGFTFRDWLLRDSNLACVRETERFRRLLEALESAEGGGVGARAPSVLSGVLESSS